MGKTQHISIRDAQAPDADELAALIYSTSLACCFSADQPCPAWYKESVDVAHIAQLLNDEKMVWLVATQDNLIAGVLAIRERCHIKYYFVAPSFQNRGIGKRLWQAAHQQGVFGESVTVRSSLNAVTVYERLGFVTTEPPNIFNGLHYQAMVMELPSPQKN
ncbi:MAG: GNAT family N-acetyltransferase [Gammaproteobacteria bacterium]|nr:GNAT family N-acetyltransferase [Gammaproteobacteria bacterium]MDH5651462.1 GNAT family N-acetyltransferase [Gammaproteobacteria bacterium]